MKIKGVLWLVLVGVGLQTPTLGMAGSFSTSFDISNVESNGIIILSCPSPGWKPGQTCSQITVTKWDLGQRWPDNGLQRKLKLDLSNHQSGGVKTTDIPLTGHEKASVQFYAPHEISDHIDLGILGDNIPAVQVTGYFAMVGRNHNRLGPGYRLAIEKATPEANWLFPGTYPNGGLPFTFNPNRMYKLVIVASFDATIVRLEALVEEWVPGKGWNKVARLEHTDDNSVCETDTTGKTEGYCPIVTGKNAFAGAIFQNHPIYFDQFSVEW
ncbi:MAG: hypothetical protein A2156_03540 [Deltaproteobacteria bacterium RBG_16_48_10]|nr:MAG: hypothetical protein A2156_03540 [Deltaproteobacteria bacterium RBG_16_48_10]